MVAGSSVDADADELSARLRQARLRAEQCQDDLTALQKRLESVEEARLIHEQVAVELADAQASYSQMLSDFQLISAVTAVQAMAETLTPHATGKQGVQAREAVERMERILDDEARRLTEEIAQRQAETWSAEAQVSVLARQLSALVEG